MKFTLRKDGSLQHMTLLREMSPGDRYPSRPLSAHLPKQRRGRIARKFFALVGGTPCAPDHVVREDATAPENSEDQNWTETAEPGQDASDAGRVRA